MIVGCSRNHQLYLFDKNDSEWFMQRWFRLVWSLCGRLSAAHNAPKYDLGVNFGRVHKRITPQPLKSTIFTITYLWLWWDHRAHFDLIIGFRFSPSPRPPSLSTR